MQYIKFADRRLFGKKIKKIMRILLTKTIVKIFS